MGFVARSSFFVSSLLASLLATLPASSSLRANDKVTETIDRGVDYLVKEVEKARVEADRGEGQVALETYALVVAGMSHQHPTIRANFEWLRNQKTATKAHTYTLACYIFALDAAISQDEQDLLLLAPNRARLAFRDDPRIGREYRPELAKAVETLEKLQVKSNGGWDYGAPKERFDNSNTQFAVLGLGVGVKRRAPVATETWIGILDHFVTGQSTVGKETDRRITLATPTEKEDRENEITLIGAGRQRGSARRRGGDDGKEGGEKGSGEGRTVVLRPPNPEVGVEDLEVIARGWNYTSEIDKPGNWNMSCAGLSSLILARENLAGRLTLEQAAGLNKAIRDGYGYLMTSWAPTHSYYGVYSLEKVGDLGGVKLFHTNDWYREVSDWLVKEQRADGSWAGGKSHGETPRVATSFALLVLNRATSLITKNPLQRIIASGKSGSDDPNDRSWVYVPKIDRTMHYPSLMRNLRMRPNPKLVGFLEDIIDAYPLEWKGELVPELAKTRDALPRGAHKIMDRYLLSITGEEYEDISKYLEWSKRWSEVIDIGLKKDKSKTDEVIAAYRNEKSAGLRRTMLWALVQLNARGAIPLMLADLDASDADLRSSAYSSLKAFFLDTPPSFDATASSATREKQAAAVRVWCERENARLGG